jgi:Ca-activated chloride channel family protein
MLPKAEEKPAMEKSLDASRRKLDKKKTKKAIVLWKKLAIAASLLLFSHWDTSLLKPIRK